MSEIHLRSWQSGVDYMKATINTFLYSFIIEKET